MSNLEKIHKELIEINRKLTIMVGLASQLVDFFEKAEIRAEKCFNEFAPLIIRKLEEISDV